MCRVLVKPTRRSRPSVAIQRFDARSIEIWGKRPTLRGHPRGGAMQRFDIRCFAEVVQVAVRGWKKGRGAMQRTTMNRMTGGWQEGLLAASLTTIPAAALWASLPDGRGSAVAALAAGVMAGA